MMIKKIISSVIILFVTVSSFANDFYIAPSGDDANPGTLASPLATIQRAQELANSGDTVYIRGGVYMLQESQIARFNSIWAYVTELDKDGINYFAYQNERPVFDYSNVTPLDKRVFAFYIRGNNIHIKGIDITGVQVTITNANTQSECIEIDGGSFNGSNNIIENVNMYDNMAIGIYILRGKNNLILNCDAYNNYDPVSQTGGGRNGGNVDGFGIHVRNGDVGNVFRGCRAWLNSDDGFDAINSGEPAVFENCWAFSNGYSSPTGDINNIVSRGDGNGFKAGGYGLGGTSYSNLLSRYDPIPTNTIQFCIAAGNKQSGFYANHHLEGNNWYNNSAYFNKRNYNMSNAVALTFSDYRTTGPGWNHVLVNNLGLGATLAELTNIDFARCTLTDNSFDPGTSISVSSSDFISLDMNLLTAPRQADGSLPDIDFMKLNPNSPLVDAGTDIGLPFNGNAPDLGHSEIATLSTPDENLQGVFSFTNYPNPFTTETNIKFELHEPSEIKLLIYNMMGMLVHEIPNKEYSSGENTINLKRNNLTTGNYIIALQNETGIMDSKVIIVK